MSTYDDSKFKFFGLEDARPGLFGETYVIAVGIHTSGPYFKGESIVLTQRPSPRLSFQRFKYSSTGVPPDLLTVDVDFMLSEALGRSEIRLIDLLYERAHELQRPDLLGGQLRLSERAISPLVRCWIRGMFHDQLLEVARETECASLERHITLVSKLPTID